MKKLFYSSIILTLFIPLFLCGCGENYSLNKDKDKPDKVVLIGIDGATWKIILPLIREGKLPHMAELMREGSWGVLSSEDPLRSPVLWTTIATGKSFRQHGIINVAKQEAGSPKYTYYTSKDRKAKAFWNILTDYGISSGVVEWWASWPAEKINGYIVSDYFRFASPPFEAFKKDFSVTDMVYPEPIFKIVEKYKNITTIPEEFSYPEEKGMTLDEAEEFTREAGENDIDARKIRKMILINNVRTCSKDDLRTFFTGQNLLKAFPTDLFAIYFQRVDSICHSFWEFFEPDKNCNLHTSREEIRLFREIIPKYYEWQDSLIGNLLLNLDKKNTTVMIVSDHGFKRYCNPSPHSFNMNYLFEKLGWLKLKDRNILWSETVAYQPLGLRDSYHPICLNLKGRDPQGIVTIEEYENWREKIKERLSALETENG
ncbi:MAG: alkaline phosphatase family protein, partial [Candidatus Omnitrophica bacterium]|nr:alkaline phosphatase family protein [Candidatus Omnitrophota bacterium]